MSPIPYLIGGALIVGLLMTAVWFVYRKTDNAGIVDVAWGLGLAMLGVYYAFATYGYFPRKLLAAGMVTFWGVRLSLHILDRWLSEAHEDRRYTAIRNKWQTNIPRKFFVFFQFQALIQLVLSLPFLAMCMNARASLSAFEYIGLWLWVIALGGEALADHQLRQFRTNPDNKGKVCEDGLWAYSRHPNYFFEWVIWVAFAVAASASPWGWLGWLGAGVMYYILNYVTGVPLTEEQSLKSRGDAYRAYQQRTSAFFPLPRKG